LSSNTVTAIIFNIVPLSSPSTCALSFSGHISREGDEDFITTELFGLWEGLGIKWVKAENRGDTPILGAQDVARLMADLRGEHFKESQPQ